MWLGAGVDFLDQHWVDFFDQYWPYAALAALVAVLVLLWKTWNRVRSIEAQVTRLQRDVVQLQDIESRRLLAALRSGPLAVIQSNGPDSQSIVPEAMSSSQPSQVTILKSLLMLVLAAMLAFEWHVIQEVGRERDTLESKISALQGIAFDRATNEEELAQARSANAAALNAANVARAELTHAQSALAAANRTIKEAHKELAVERQAREAAESSAQDAREQLAFEKARVLGLAANHEPTQQPPGNSEADNAQSALAAANRTIKEAHKELAVERQAREAAESSAQDAREQLAFEKARVLGLAANHEPTQQPPGNSEADSAQSVTTATTPTLSAPTQPSISTTARPKRVSTKSETPRRKKASTLRALPQGRQVLGQP